MAKKRLVNNDLGGNQIVYTDSEKDVKKDTIETYNVSANNIEVDKLVQKVYDEFHNGKERKLMLQGIDYYNGNSDIDSKTRFDHAGSMAKKNDKLSNAQIHKNFMRKLTRQKVTYLLGKPFSIETENDVYKALLEDEYFQKPTYRLVFNLLKEAVKEGINWINTYYDENGTLMFRRVPGNQVKVFWADREHTKIAQLIHYYEIEIYQADDKRSAIYADYYSPAGVIHYVKEKEGFVRDSERPNEEGNFTVMVPQTSEIKNDKGEVVEIVHKLDEEGKIVFEPQQMVWEKIPWIPLKYNEEETSLLKYIKSYQDNYEKLLSAMIDIVIDIPEAIKVFKGYSGANLEELTELIAQFRAIIVDPDGDVKALETLFNAESSNTILDRIRKDTYEDGAGVDTQNQETGEKSGVALKFLYSDLDLDSEELEQELNVFFEWLLWFIDFDIMIKGKGDFSEEEVTIQYHKTLIINESEIIDNINKSREMIPDKILLPMHPLVEDVSAVEDAIAEKQKEQEQQMQKEMQLYGNTPLINPQAKKGVEVRAKEEGNISTNS